MSLGLIAMYPVIWFMVLFCVLPLRYRSQGDAGEIVPGTPEGAPSDLRLGAKAWLTTVIAAVLWGILFAVVASGTITVRDLDVFHRMRPVEAV